MAMPTVFMKENEGILNNPVFQPSSTLVPWWSGLGSQPVDGGSGSQFKFSHVEQSTGGGQLTAPKDSGCDMEQGLEKGSILQFTISPGDCKTSSNGQKPSKLQAATAVQSALADYRGHLELGFGQPVGRVMLPMNLTTDDGTVYVNAKQYHGIIRRRLSRAKAKSQDNVLRVRKPYLHLSRHLHAMRRPRGCGGRFLNKKIINGDKGGAEKEKTTNRHLSRATESQNSEVLQSESGNLNSPTKANGSMPNILGSEVTSIFSRRDLNHFGINHLRPSVRAPSETTRGLAMSGKWVGAADGSYHLKV
ncbi:nuclear transcription factor Y subunit A-10-like isoform X2 [Diospyros lotus]|uniref:nuclear transcription factor Y subunit A-10-like isoform X2 n=1 Tax=Diospyros lotus TaxID=55363 RepID=UPI0022537317|nr:nuclear transcription factor Y subunit A-10-like isoform X2 [Diospyros lotus]